MNLNYTKQLNSTLLSLSKNVELFGKNELIFSFDVKDLHNVAIALKESDNEPNCILTTIEFNSRTGAYDYLNGCSFDYIIDCVVEDIADEETFTITILPYNIDTNLNEVFSGSKDYQAEKLINSLFYNSKYVDPKINRKCIILDQKQGMTILETQEELLDFINTSEKVDYRMKVMINQYHIAYMKKVEFLKTIDQELEQICKSY